MTTTTIAAAASTIDRRHSGAQSMMTTDIAKLH
jgi:hypothetical protein